MHQRLHLPPVGRGGGPGAFLLVLKGEACLCSRLLLYVGKPLRRDVEVCGPLRGHPVTDGSALRLFLKRSLVFTMSPPTGGVCSGGMAALERRRDVQGSEGNGVTQGGEGRAPVAPSVAPAALSGPRT